AAAAFPDRRPRRLASAVRLGGTPSGSRRTDRYRSGSLTKPAIREQLHALFGVYDSLRAKVQIDEVRAVGEEAWVYSTGEVSGRVRGLGLWMLIFSWKREPEIARREQGVWRLYGDQK